MVSSLASSHRVSHRSSRRTDQREQPKTDIDDKKLKLFGRKSYLPRELVINGVEVDPGELRDLGEPLRHVGDAVPLKPVQRRLVEDLEVAELDGLGEEGEGHGLGVQHQLLDLEGGLLLGPGGEGVHVGQQLRLGQPLGARSLVDGAEGRGVAEAGHDGVHQVAPPDRLLDRQLALSISYSHYDFRIAMIFGCVENMTL